ncbi:MAG: ribosomal L7Ae/L30e/S12e/Gadd45 family protein [Oscillospiraceae bacterium]|nr:ribosomal L7Ae/L30e/S12e/Gadd45 family protein [Oscillospiraceae bacterium]
MKQTHRAVREGLAERVFLAGDAEEHIRRPVLELCAETGTPLEAVGSMKELGQACGIEVGASVAALLKE